MSSGVENYSVFDLIRTKSCLTRADNNDKPSIIGLYSLFLCSLLAINVFGIAFIQLVDSTAVAIGRQ